MMIISYRGLRSSNKGKIFGQIACHTLLWIMWPKRNGTNFLDKRRMIEVLWDLLHFYSFFFSLMHQGF